MCRSDRHRSSARRWRRQEMPQRSRQQGITNGEDISRVPTRHHQSDFGVGYAFRFDLACDLSVIDHKKTVGERRHLLKLRRYQKDGATSIAQSDQLAVDELDRSDIDTTRWLRYQKKF